ncbi:MAG: methyltransferase domain-containing protein [Chloroflexota bacterium]
MIRLLDPDLRRRVDALEWAVTAWRRAQGRPAIPRGAYAELPFGPATDGDPEWRLRRADLRWIRQVLAGRPGTGGRALRVLDLGAWNGWLSTRLATDGHAVTGLDLFAGPDALGARLLMPGRWRAVQADPMDPAMLRERFDVVILDRCLAFQPDPVAALDAAASVVDPGGAVLVTGIALHRDPDAAGERLAAEREAFRARFGMDLLLRPTSGVLGRSELPALDRRGWRRSDHPFLRIANLRTRVDGRRPRNQVAILEVGA